MENSTTELITNITFGIVTILISVIGIVTGARRWIQRGQEEQASTNIDIEALSQPVRGSSDSISGSFLARVPLAADPSELATVLTSTTVVTSPSTLVAASSSSKDHALSEYPSELKFEPLNTPAIADLPTTVASPFKLDAVDQSLEAEQPSPGSSIESESTVATTPTTTYSHATRNSSPRPIILTVPSIDAQACVSPLPIQSPADETNKRTRTSVTTTQPGLE